MRLCYRIGFFLSQFLFFRWWFKGFISLLFWLWTWFQFFSLLLFLSRKGFCFFFRWRWWWFGWLVFGTFWAWFSLVIFSWIRNSRRRFFGSHFQLRLQQLIKLDLKLKISTFIYIDSSNSMIKYFLEPISLLKKLLETILNQLNQPTGVSPLHSV